MLKVFSLFGVLCVSSPTDFGYTCFNFWEDPVTYYETLEECQTAGTQKAIEIKVDGHRKGLTFTRLDLWCIEVNKGEKA